jgi:pimeloyl-ACP methyl ester carboxylesterase
MPSDRVRAWRLGGRLETILGREIFVRRQLGTGPLLLLLHGFPSSSFDWRHTVVRLPGQRWVAPDSLGFGFSQKPPVRNDLFLQADIVERLLAGEQGPVVIAAHDMGTSIATELMARDIEGRLGFQLAGVLLFNGSVIVERASLTRAQQVLLSPAGPLLAQLSTARVFKQQFAKLFSAAHPLSPAEAEDQWWLWQRARGARRAHLLINYVRQRRTHAARWHGAVSDWPGELRLVWGLRDPVATVNVLDGLRELRPGVAVTELPELGHYPQLEDPAAIAAAVTGLLADAS